MLHLQTTGLLACTKTFLSDSVRFLMPSRGIPYPLHNQSAQPWLGLEKAPRTKAVSSEASCSGLIPSNPSRYWYEDIVHNGQSSFMNSNFKSNYKVFRNVVVDYHADNTGRSDASKAIQKAITGTSSGKRSKRFINRSKMAHPTDQTVPKTRWERLVNLRLSTYLAGHIS